MTAICVDDEALIMQLTVSLCREIPLLDEVKGFLRAQQALEWLKTNNADLALLDIDMPEIDGLRLAERIKELQPQIAVIFLTGHAQFAVDAFALHACGYLLKPISRERLAAEVAYALSNRAATAKPSVKVRTFGNFEIYVDSEPVTFGRSKAKELLAYLIDRQGSGVTRAEAFSALWENSAYDRARQKQFDVIVRSLRDTLQQVHVPDLLQIHGGYMRIAPEQLDCDFYRFLQGDAESLHAFRGEYMCSYPWASLTEAYLTRTKNQNSI